MLKLKSWWPRWSQKAMPARSSDENAPANPWAPFEYDFFVSYTTRENEIMFIRPLIEDMIDALWRKGFTAWPFWLDVKDLRDFHGGEKELHRRLRDGMNRCVAMLAFTSPNYLLSEYCWFEYRHFHATSPRDFVGVINWKDSRSLWGWDYTIDRPRASAPAWWDSKAHGVWCDFAESGTRLLSASGDSFCSDLTEWFSFIERTARFLSDARGRRMERSRILEAIRENENRGQNRR